MSDYGLPFYTDPDHAWSFLERIVERERAVRKAGHTLRNASEWALYNILVDAICGWGMWSRKITDEELLLGRDEYPMVGRVPFEERTLRNAKKALRDAGLIRIKRGRDASIYTIVWDEREWIDVTANYPTSKRQRAKEVAEEDTSSYHGDDEAQDEDLGRQILPVKAANSAGQGGNICHPYSKNPVLATVDGTIDAGDGRQPQSEEEGSGQREAKAVQGKVRSRSKAKHVKAKSFQHSTYSGYALAKTWTDAHTDAFGPVSLERPMIAWTNKQGSQVTAFAKRWPEDGAADFHNFLDFAVKNWQKVVRHELDWMGSTPEWPEIGFLVRWFDPFFEAWCQDRLQWFITEDAKSKIEKLQATGMSYQDALVRVEVSEAVAEHSKNFDIERREIVRLNEVLTLREKELNARPQWSADNPHPKASKPKADVPSMNSRGKK